MFPLAVCTLSPFCCTCFAGVLRTTAFIAGSNAMTRSCSMTITLTAKTSERVRDRTSLAGLAPDSATSSALGRAPLYNAGPHPGTTWSYKAGEIIHQLIEQPGHAG
ncbi:hypothetical protein TNCT_406831 [Trichonephila clavata]|uniref:Uncharacterized protein n=1 Tax=Trichonephila clavata TaxID=2740835 RepID=A0A8X6JBI1_TRICU|nr:hypothetical protein TNCT_406831 [Trichonephila clavata]